VQAFSSVILRTIVQQLRRFQLTYSDAPSLSLIAKLLLLTRDLGYLPIYLAAIFSDTVSKLILTREQLEPPRQLNFRRQDAYRFWRLLASAASRRSIAYSVDISLLRYAGAISVESCQRLRRA